MVDSLARLSSMLESARDLTIEAAASASARLADTPIHMRPAEISNLLNSRADRDKLNGMKCLISLVSRGENGSGYFADVVKNVTSSNLQLRKLVFIYLTKFAELNPDTVLLSINAIQRSLGESDPNIRAAAIRVMAGIRIPAISTILSLGIKKCVSDLSPIVRSASAIAISKCYETENSNREQLMEYLKQLLTDQDISVLSSAIKTLYKIAPKSYELLHGHFRYFCKILVDLDEWSQAILVELMTDYSRKYLHKPKLANRASNEVIDLPDDYSTISFPVYDVTFDPDLKLFLESIKYLIYSRTESVVLSVGRAFFYLTPPKVFQEYQIDAAFVRLMTSQQLEVSFFVLQSILIMALQDPSLFVQYSKRFYLFPNDSFKIAKCKLEILSLLCNENNARAIIDELQYYALNLDKKIASESIKAIGRCAQISSIWSSKVLKWALKQFSNTHDSDHIVGELLTVIRCLIQESGNSSDNIKILYKLAQYLDTNHLNADAKASVIWLVGEFSGVAKTIGPDVLRKLIKNFANEPDQVRYQILSLAGKIYSYDVDRFKQENSDSLDGYDQNGIIPKMFRHILHLTKYDNSFDTRDRSRMFNFLLNSSNEQMPLATLFFQVPKPAPIISLNHSFIVTGETNKPSNLTFDEKVSILQINGMIINFNKVTKWSNQDRLPSSEIRTEIPTKSYEKNLQSFTARTNSPPASSTAISSDQFQNFVPQQSSILPKPSYKLQSLDEFFAAETKNDLLNQKLLESSDEDDDDDEDGDEDDDEEDEEDEDEEEFDGPDESESEYEESSEEEE